MGKKQTDEGNFAGVAESPKPVGKKMTFVERKLKVINEMENKALARYLAERLKKR